MLQRLAYLFVIFVLFPLVIWTGLAMSPGFRFRVSSRGQRAWAASNPRARFISSSPYFFCCSFWFTSSMICLAGFRNRMRAMITGRAGTHMERT